MSFLFLKNKLLDPEAERWNSKIFQSRNSLEPELLPSVFYIKKNLISKEGLCLSIVVIPEQNMLPKLTVSWCDIKNHDYKIVTIFLKWSIFYAKCIAPDLYFMFFPKKNIWNISPWKAFVVLIFVIQIRDAVM